MHKKETERPPLTESLLWWKDVKDSRCHSSTLAREITRGAREMRSVREINKNEYSYARWTLMHWWEHTEKDKDNVTTER